MGQGAIDYIGVKGGLDINGIIESYYAYAGENISAGDFVEFVNGLSGNSFIESSSYQVFNNGMTRFMDCCKLDSNRVLIAYQDLTETGNPGNVAIITISGSKITIGTDYVFGSTGTTYISVGLLTNNKVLIAYCDNGPGKAVIASISGTVITFGTPVSYNSTTTYYNSISILSETRALVTFYKYSSSSLKYTSSVVAVISDTSITFGTVYNANSDGATYYQNSCKITSTKVLITYELDNSTDYGYAIIASITGATVSYGTAVIFDTNYVERSSLALLDTTRVLVSYYSNSDGGKCQVLKIAGTEITTNTSYKFNNSIGGDELGSCLLEPNKALVTYASYDSGYSGCAIVASISDVVITFGEEYIYREDRISTSVVTSHEPTIMINSNTALLLYNYIFESSNNEDFGELILLGIDNTTVSNNIVVKEYETQVRKATKVPCIGVAKTSGIGGDETAHNEQVEIYVPDI